MYTRLLREDEAIKLPNMVLELRTEKIRLLGYDGIARDSDKVSAVHFPPALEKAYFVRNK